jgi:NAD(P)-dependent dehydrogenase (short-subunit alcohol dehydrogenase family)
VFRRVPFLEMNEALWDETFAVNLTGTLLACQAVLPRMRAQKAGSIVLMSSSLARTGTATGGHYAATKGGVLGLGRSLALEYAQDGIRVNIVSPGLTDTPQPRAHAGGIAAMHERGRHFPLGRIGETSDIVSAITFLLDDDSSYVTGQDIRVNGGSQIS